MNAPNLSHLKIFRVLKFFLILLEVTVAQVLSLARFAAVQDVS